MRAVQEGNSFLHYPKPTLVFPVSLSCNNSSLSRDILMDDLRSTGSNLQVFLDESLRFRGALALHICDQKAQTQLNKK
jgi:hypothetical protein